MLVDRNVVLHSLVTLCKSKIFIYNECHNTCVSRLGVFTLIRQIICNIMYIYYFDSMVCIYLKMYLCWINDTGLMVMVTSKNFVFEYSMAWTYTYNMYDKRKMFKYTKMLYHITETMTILFLYGNHMRSEYFI